MKYKIKIIQLKINCIITHTYNVDLIKYLIGIKNWYGLRIKIRYILLVVIIIPITLNAIVYNQIFHNSLLHIIIKQVIH